MSLINLTVEEMWNQHPYLFILMILLSYLLAYIISDFYIILKERKRG